MEEIEVRFESDAAHDDLERQAVGDDRFDANDREHVLRRIAFYRSDRHLALRAAQGLIALEETR